MTVCIAAMCSEPADSTDASPGIYVVCASDRMLTAGVGDADIEYQPVGTPKLFNLNNAVAIMMAGDMFVQRDVLQRMIPQLNERIAAGQGWVGVREMAEMYSKHHVAVFREKAEQVVFSKYGFGYETFAKLNRELAPKTIELVKDDLDHFEAGYPRLWTLFAGLDSQAAHIYSVVGGEIHCHDATGFAAIGFGARHASSQFMLARHSAKKRLADTIQLTYFAKKRAEVAPGVGGLTDMCLVGPLPGSLRMFEQTKEIAELDSLYKTSRNDENRLRRKARKGISDFVRNLNRPPTQQVTGPAGPTGPWIPSGTEIHPPSVSQEPPPGGATGPTGPTGPRAPE